MHVSQYSTVSARLDGSARACALIDNFHVQTYTCVFAKLFFPNPLFAAKRQKDHWELAVMVGTKVIVYKLLIVGLLLH